MNFYNSLGNILYSAEQLCVPDCFKGSSWCNLYHTSRMKHDFSRDMREEFWERTKQGLPKTCFGLSYRYEVYRKFFIHCHLIFDMSVNGKSNFSLRTPIPLRQGLLDLQSGQM